MKFNVFIKEYSRPDSCFEKVETQYDILKSLFVTETLDNESQRILSESLLNAATMCIKLCIQKLNDIEAQLEYSNTSKTSINPLPMKRSQSTLNALSETLTAINDEINATKNIFDDRGLSSTILDAYGQSVSFEHTYNEITRKVTVHQRLLEILLTNDEDRNEVAVQLPLVDL